MTTAIVVNGRTSPYLALTNEELEKSLVSLTKKIFEWKGDLEKNLKNYYNLSLGNLLREEYHKLASCYLGIVESIDRKIQKFESEINVIQKIVKERNISPETVAV